MAKTNKKNVKCECGKTFVQYLKDDGSPSNKVCKHCSGIVLATQRLNKLRSFCRKQLSSLANYPFTEKETEQIANEISTEVSKALDKIQNVQTVTEDTGFKFSS